jgi:branched-chain amino acid aminotransferase
MKNRIVYLNEEFIGWENATAHLMCHSFGRGSAIFEVLSLHEMPEGPAVFRLDAHIERFFRTAQLLDMKLPCSGEELEEAVRETVRRNGLRQGFIKIVGFYSRVVLDIQPPDDPLDISIFALDPARDMAGPDFSTDRSTTLCISRWRKLDPQTVPVEAKAAANYLNGIMAQNDARKRGFEQGLMLDTQGFIAELGTEAVFLVKDGRLLAPAMGTILDSITRRSVLEVARTEGMDLYEGRLHPDLLFEAEEIFVCCTPMKVLPVRQVEDRKLERVPGPLSLALSEKLDRVAKGQDERFRGWMFPVNG